VVSETGRDKELIAMFPDAKALFINKSGSPKHPLYCRKDTALIDYKVCVFCGDKLVYREIATTQAEEMAKKGNTMQICTTIGHLAALSI
jgi:hypothetical protein